MKSGDTDYTLLDLQPEKMKNKNYDLLALSVVNLEGYIGDDNKRVINKKEFKKILKQILHLTYYKINIIIDTFLELDIMSEDSDNYYINPAKAPFLNIKVDTIKYCLQNLSAFNFKVYCYLLNIYHKHVAYHFKENYYFSAKELMEMSGYDRNQNGYKKINQSLDTLESVGLIKYNHDAVGRPGKHGLYHELFEACEYSTVQLRVDKELSKDVEYLALDNPEPDWYYKGERRSFITKQQMIDIYGIEFYEQMAADPANEKWVKKVNE